MGLISRVSSRTYRKKNQKCKFLSKPSPEKRSPSRLNPPIPSKTSNLKSKIKKVFHQISNDSFLPVNNLKTVELYRIIIFKKSPLFIWSFVSVVVSSNLL